MSLQTIGKINEALARRPAELEKARAEGKKVAGWFNYNVPEEIIHAAGLIPVHLGTGGDNRLVELGARYISAMNCVFTRQIMGQFAEGGDEYIKNSDVVFIDVTCKQLYRVYELVRYYFKARAEILGVPYNFQVGAGKEYFRREVAAFAAKLEKISGSEITGQALRHSVDVYAGIRAAVRELERIQAGPETPITWHEVYDVIQAAYYLDKDTYLSLLGELLSEIKDAPANPKVKTDAPRILISGSVIPPGDRKVLDLVEESGGRVVVDDLWSGFAPYLDTDVEEASLEGIADAYLARHPHGSLPVLDIGQDKRLKNIKKLVRDYRVNGVLFHTLRYCDCFTFKAAETKNVLKTLGVPFLEIHTEYARSDIEAIRTRLEAFIESLGTRLEITSGLIGAGI
ncbi:MAG: 2-hydroxyacyl-CoA dehydratase family protein [Spirochaetia bacterium]|jgi:benzoyl-CoA reductase/2-hydroxyglutaryl-CoA dehydratase subunit BcrC/BadD/HgdB|nr:2-hydroxyacyl-CoA dehydratase family protein [Spirochaetia bacterium]